MRRSLTSLLAIALLGDYASTPQDAAIKALYFEPHKPAVVTRVNVVGAHAAVLTSGGRIEGTLVTEPVLVGRFSFGWQALEVLDWRCTLDAHRLGEKTDTSLMAGMPQPKDDRPCRADSRDVGPLEEVESVRRVMRGPLVPHVRVAGTWALGEWYGAGGGESLYVRRSDGWHLVESGGGAIGVDYMRKYGVPRSAWCGLGIFDAKC